MKKRRIGPVRMAIRVVLTVVSLYVALQVFRAYLMVQIDMPIWHLPDS